MSDSWGSCLNAFSALERVFPFHFVGGAFCWWADEVMVRTLVRDLDGVSFLREKGSMMFRIPRITRAGVNWTLGVLC